MKKIITIAVLLFFVSGCAAIPFPKLTTPKKPETVYNWNETTRTTPKAIVFDGKVVVVEETEKTLQVGLDTTPAKLSFLQRIGNWISGLSLIGFLILIACMILAPGATLAWVVKLLFKWKRAFKETASAIKEAKSVEKDADLRNTLSSKQSTVTKKIVDELKRGL